METETVALCEGDVYRWRYREPGDDGQWGRYHCCSCIAIVYDGRLRDTYWMIGSDYSGGRSFGRNDLPKLTLTRLGNLGDFEKAREYNAEYYDDADILNLNHSNSSSGNFYLRKGAVRSASKMLEVARRKLEKALSDEQWAKRQADDMRSVIAKIEAGDTSVHL